MFAHHSSNAGQLWAKVNIVKRGDTIGQKWAFLDINGHNWTKVGIFGHMWTQLDKIEKRKNTNQN